MANPTDDEKLVRALGDALGNETHATALLSGHAWRRLCHALEEAQRLVVGPEVPSDPRHRAEGYRYLARFLAAGLRSCLTHDDPDYPMLQRMIDYSTPWGLDHPDCLYLYAPLRGGTSYTLFGNRGSANVFDVQINAGHFSTGRVDAVTTQATLDHDSLSTDAHGNFVVRIGPDAPTTNGLQMGPDARFLQVRQYFADWDHEHPADLQIERDDAIWPIPAPRPALIGRQLKTLVHWIERAGTHWEQLSTRLLSMPENSMVVHEPVGHDAQGALSGQVYGMGNFRCDPDEAVLLRLTVPVCAHWNVSLSNWYWECIEYASRQSSLNHHQAQTDTSGHVHCVIAHRDPGVANWLDPADHPRGSLSLRMHKATGQPEVELTRLPLDRLDSVLPANAPRVTPEERAALLTRRRRSVLRRFRT